MKLYNIYVADVIIPMGFTLHRELKTVKTEIVVKDKDKYRDLISGDYYEVRSNIGTIRIHRLTPLSDYYNIFGQKKKNNYRNQSTVDEKVKILKNRNVL